MGRKEAKERKGKVLFVHCATMGTTSQVLERLSAFAAKIWGGVVAQAQGNGKDGIGREKRIAYVDVCGQSEEKVEYEAYAGHAEQVADGIFEFELLAYVIDGCQSRDEHKPYACEER